MNNIQRLIWLALIMNCVVYVRADEFVVDTIEVSPSFRVEVQNQTDEWNFGFALLPADRETELALKNFIAKLDELPPGEQAQLAREMNEESIIGRSSTPLLTSFRSVPLGTYELVAIPDEWNSWGELKIPIHVVKVLNHGRALVTVKAPGLKSVQVKFELPPRVKEHDDPYIRFVRLERDKASAYSWAMRRLKKSENSWSFTFDGIDRSGEYVAVLASDLRRDRYVATFKIDIGALPEEVLLDWKSEEEFLELRRPSKRE